MKRIYLITAVLLITVSVSAQKKRQPENKQNKCSCGFQGIVQGGLLDGSVGPSWNIQTVNGAYYKTWFAGLGVGLDYYTMRTVPLFLDVRKEIFNRKRTPFFYADAGIHFDWLRSKEKSGWGSSDYDRGLYYDAGVGYKFGLGKRDALQLSMGYTMKTLREERVVVLQCFQWPCNASKEYFSYRFSRLSFKVGWQFR